MKLMAHFTRLGEVHNMNFKKSPQKSFQLEINGFLKPHKNSFKLILNHENPKADFAFLKNQKLTGTLQHGNTILDANKHVQFKLTTTLKSVIFTIHPPSHLTNQTFTMNLTFGPAEKIALNGYHKFVSDGIGGGISVCANGKSSETCDSNNNVWVEDTCECIPKSEKNDNKFGLGCNTNADCLLWAKVYKGLYDTQDRHVCCKKQALNGYVNNCESRIKCISQTIVGDLFQPSNSHPSNFLNALNAITLVDPFLESVDLLDTGFTDIGTLLSRGLSSITAGIAKETVSPVTGDLVLDPTILNDLENLLKETQYKYNDLSQDIIGLKNSVGATSPEGIARLEDLTKQQNKLEEDIGNLRENLVNYGQPEKKASELTPSQQKTLGTVNFGLGQSTHLYTWPEQVYITDAKVVYDNYLSLAKSENIDITADYIFNYEGNAEDTVNYIIKKYGSTNKDALAFWVTYYNDLRLATGGKTFIPTPL